jgi:Uma2 family endonuclease
MRGILLEVGPEVLAQRKLRGLYRCDEMWEGVLHMGSSPGVAHQRTLAELSVFLHPLVKESKRGTLQLGINVFSERSREEDYRIPDLTFVAAGRESILKPDGIRGGGPDAVVEIRSPGDESYDKLPFFAALEVREVVIIDRDSKRPEVFRLAGSQYLAVAPDREGWVPSECLGVRFRADEGQRLLVEDVQDPSLRTQI